MAINDIVLVCIIVVFTISGFVGGFIKKISKIAGFVVGLFGSFYLGSYVSKLIQSIGSVKTFCESNGWCSILILVLSYIIVFIVISILCRLIFKSLQKVFEAGPVGKVLNKILGLVFGICLGFIVCNLYSWGLYITANVSESAANWIISDCKLNDPSAFTLTKSLIEMNLNAANITFPHL